MVEPMPCDIAASFKNIGISSTHPAKQILSNVSGYIVKGGITAILGPSAAGKSLFMRVLSGRVHNLKVTGDFHIDGNRVDYRDISNSISFVPQEDVLIGELTPRETLYNSAAMKRAKSTSELNEDVAHLLEVLGLTEVADNTIGTTFVRGISGGQKKRVDIGTELVAAPKLLFLDEPTSGLDASIAFDVLKSIYDIARASNGKLSILLSIHQPNSRLLELIDHIIVLGDGSMNFFGTVPESVAHLRSIGFPPPDDYTPTDYFLQVSDKKFAGHSELNFAGGQFFHHLPSARIGDMNEYISHHSLISLSGSFSSSQLNLNLMTFLTDVVQDSNRRINKDADCISPVDESQYGDLLVASENGIIIDYARYVNFDGEKTTFWRQYSTLVRRDLMIAMRDPSLYYMQFSLVLVSGLLVGSAYYKAMDNPNKTLFNVSSGLLWVLFLMAYIPIFKVMTRTIIPRSLSSGVSIESSAYIISYTPLTPLPVPLSMFMSMSLSVYQVYHLSRGSLRFKHERANNTYTVLAAFAAELTTTPIGLICFIPGTMISYFMFGAPSSDYAFYMFVCWLVSDITRNLEY
jgi:ABC-type multidrug transport system ATPase subunit